MKTSCFPERCRAPGDWADAQRVSVLTEFSAWKLAYDTVRRVFNRLESQEAECRKCHESGKPVSGVRIY